MRIRIHNRQRRLPLRTSRLESLARALMEQACGRTTDREWTSLEVHVTGDDGIRAANLQVFGRDKPTDVISLAYPPMPPLEKAWRGELIVNAARAAAEGAVRSGGAARELALYIAHGCDHLGGADDDTPERRRRMLARENRWLDDPAVQPMIALLLPAPGRRRTVKAHG